MSQVSLFGSPTKHRHHCRDGGHWWTCEQACPKDCIESTCPACWALRLRDRTPLAVVEDSDPEHVFSNKSPQRPNTEASERSA